MQEKNNLQTQSSPDRMAGAVFVQRIYLITPFCKITLA